MPFIVTSENANGLRDVHGVFYMAEGALRAACDEIKWDLPDDKTRYFVSEVEMDVHVTAPEKKFVVRRDGDKPVIEKWEGER